MKQGGFSTIADDSSKAVAVVGAGVVGLCAALEAQRKGYQVTLIDRDEAGLGASFGNAGYLATELIDPLSTPKTLFSSFAMWLNPYGPLSLPLGYLHRILPWLFRFICAAAPKTTKKGRLALKQLNVASVPAWRRCLEDIGAQEQLVQSGYLLVWESAGKLEEAKKHAAYMQDNGIKTELVQGERLAYLEPELAENLSHALYFPEACRVKEPYELCKILLSAFQARGGTFLQQSVTFLQSEGKGVLVQTEKSSLKFDNTIICAGAWSKQLLREVGLDVPLEAERGYHLSIDAEHIKLNHPIGSAERRFVMTPLDSGLRVVGITELGGLKLKPFKQRFDSLQHHSGQLLSQLNNPTLEVSKWMGHRPTLPDSLPVIDRHPKHSQLLFAFGNQHLGLTQAAISAELVVGLMSGDLPTINYEPFRVDRF
ncbi:NAD(P)/FAD-dependent oxidoreductase [Neptunomonas japonica]|uniref:D-amino-acid dehydrogenase n=1 Tax=Neptunomonas japonica JAMM 1380 TaxID=1441457 RepID=A0A7R6PEM5_9GAMM|nr:FAD-dependent oxidoreductase [Neptunomonas japonica]BBB28103.1 D-amino-acid dehydrogenase [Neptunomonas japonica JAMM 1380]